ncbi:MAG: geranylgeranyl reductase family protein [Candidatus Lokiarchaeota archaeon]|nr:geranylgeranyl reductase family protein [Candidatus Lokiarchaeota archaeon]
MVDKTQVIIIGSGPAGLTAARYLGELDVQYVLISKESRPGENKVCGGFVPQAALERFELGSFPRSHEIYGARLRFPGYEPRDVWFEEAVGVNARREDLGTVLEKKADLSKGILRLGARVTSVECGQDGCSVKYMLNDNTHQVESDLVIDASGSHPVSCKKDGVRSYLSDTETGYGFQYQVRYGTDEWEFPRLNYFYFGSGYSPRGYAWIYPRATDAAVGTGGLLNILRERNTALPGHLDRLLNEETPDQDYTGYLTVVKREGALVPLAGIVTPSYGQRLLLAGDAAGHCSPISGEGIYYAMTAGNLAAETVKECYEDNDFTKQKLKSYEKRWQKAFGSDLKWGRRIQRRFMGTSSGESSSKFLESEDVLRKVAEMLLGLKSVRSAIIGCLPAYIKSRLAFWQ